MMILLKSGVILGMKNKPITATTTATIATVTATPPTSKIAVEEFYDEDIVEYEDEDEVLIGMVIEFSRKQKKRVQPKVWDGPSIGFLRHKFFVQNPNTKLVNPPENFFKMGYLKEQKQKRARQHAREQREEENFKALWC